MTIHKDSQAYKALEILADDGPKTRDCLEQDYGLSHQSISQFMRMGERFGWTQTVVQITPAGRDYLKGIRTK